MNGLSTKNIRLRILFLTILTIIPVILLIFYFNIIQLNFARELEKEKLATASRIASVEHLQIIEGARQLLISLSHSPQVQNVNLDCANYLRELLTKYQRYNNFGVADLEGNAICNAAASQNQQQINVKDRLFFKNTLQDQAFSVGEYSISKTTGEPVLSFGYPIFDDNNIMKGVVYSSLDLGWLKSLETNLSLGKGSTLLILDKNGKILVSNVNNFTQGSTFPSGKLLSQLGSEASFIETSVGNEEYFYAFSKIGVQESSPYAVIGVPKSIAFKTPNTNFQNALILSGIVALSAIIGGWYIGNSLITKLILAMEKIEELRRDFVSLVSHQLRTPLTSIKYFSEILASESPGKLNKTQKEFMQDINTSTNRLISLVGTLLDISRLESNKVQLNKESVSIHEIISESLKETKPLFTEKKLQIIFNEKKKSDHIVQADKKLLKQAVFNLISNAFKYSNPHSKIEITTKKRKNLFYFSIKNSGVHIKKHEYPAIFSKFYRSMDASRMHEEGTGLGLYLSRLIINSHNGDIYFTSSKLKTVFYFTLPIT